MMSHRHYRRILTLVVLVVALGASTSALQDKQQAELIELLRIGSPEQRHAAVNRIEQIPIAARSSSLLSSLIDELDRLDQEDERAYQASLLQPSPPGVPEVEANNDYLADLLYVVCQSRDPSIVRPLIGFMHYSPLVVNTIAEFGDLGVPAVANVAIGADARRGMNASIALIALQRIFERAPESRPLSTSSRQTIVDIARRRLTGKQTPAVAITAIDLAVATREPDLLARVKALAVDEASVRRLGLVEAPYAGTIQRKAAASLATRR